MQRPLIYLANRLENQLLLRLFLQRPLAQYPQSRASRWMCWTRRDQRHQQHWTCLWAIFTLDTSMCLARRMKTRSERQRSRPIRSPCLRDRVRRFAHHVRMRRPEVAGPIHPVRLSRLRPVPPGLPHLRHRRPAQNPSLTLFPSKAKATPCAKALLCSV